MTGEVDMWHPVRHEWWLQSPCAPAMLPVLIELIRRRGRRQVGEESFGLARVLNTGIDIPGEVQWRS